MSNKPDNESSFCKSCYGMSEIKVMCPMIDTSEPGYTCVSLFYCKRCTHHKGLDLDECKVDCSYHQ